MTPPINPNDEQTAKALWYMAVGLSGLILWSIVIYLITLIF